jgi:hypothetical protein
MKPGILVALLAAAFSLLPAQAVNDTCATAIPVMEGVPVVGSNVGATTGPDPTGCNAGADVWYAFVASCTGQYVASTCFSATTFDTVVAVWSGTAGCGALTAVGCNDDNCAIGGPANTSRVNFTATAGNVYHVSVGGKLSLTGTFGLQVSLTPVMTLGFFDLGPGTIGYHVTGPPYGTYFMAVTLAPGAFPFGWFYGLDLPLFDILTQFNAGPPFVGSLSACGTATFGPVGGAPSGLTLWAVALGFAPGAQIPTLASNPTTATVP